MKAIYGKQVHVAFWMAKARILSILKWSEFSHVCNKENVHSFAAVKFIIHYLVLRLLWNLWCISSLYTAIAYLVDEDKFWMLPWKPKLFTHHVSASEDEDKDNERDLSHPVHSDNCMIQDDGTCIPDESAYAQRHYRYVHYTNNTLWTETDTSSHSVHSDNYMIQDDGTCIPDESAYAQRHYRYVHYTNNTLWTETDTSSHSVHSDNYMIQDDGTCIPDESAYAQRHYRYVLHYTNNTLWTETDTSSHSVHSDTIWYKMMAPVYLMSRLMLRDITGMYTTLTIHCEQRLTPLVTQSILITIWYKMMAPVYLMSRLMLSHITGIIVVILPNLLLLIKQMTSHEILSLK